MIVIRKIFLLCFTSLFICLAVSAQQERLFPLHSNQAIKKYLREHPKDTSGTSLANARTQSIVDTLPFIDDFSYDGIYPNPNLWSDSDVFINRDFPINPPTLGVATFDGSNKYGNPYYPTPGTDSIADHLTSNYINLNLPRDTTVWLSFFYQPQGNSYNYPLPGDSLMLEFENRDTANQWQKVWSVPGTVDTVFQQVMIHVDTSYLSGSFRFRFTNIANLGGNADQWNLDYVRLNKDRNANDTGFTNEGAFLYRNKSLLVPPYTSMPYSHFKTNPSQYVVTSDTVEYKDLTGIAINFTNDFRIVIDGAVYYDAGPNAVNVNPYSTKQFTQQLSGANLPVTPQSYLEYSTWNFKEIQDVNPQNDTVKEPNILSNYYSYDDGTAEQAYGIWNATDNSQGSLALRFDLQKPDTLTGVQIYWDQIPSSLNPHTQLLNLAVWNQLTPNTNNDNLLYQLVDTLPANDSTINGFYTYTFDSALVVSGTIYVGWIQFQQAFLNVGFDVNTDTHNLLYFNVLGAWQQSDIPGSVMIRPIFGSAPLNVGINETNKTDFTANVFPNPASNTINISVNSKHPSSYSCQLFDAIGKLVIEQKETTLNVSHLEDGFYLLKITDNKTSQFETHKILIEH